MLEGTGKVKILSPKQLIVEVLNDTIEVHERIPIELKLIDINGDPAYAPYPGLKLDLDKTHLSGAFYLSDIAENPVESVRILPAVSTATIWYSNSDQGLDTVYFRTSGQLEKDPNKILYITTGTPDLTRSTIMAEGGLVSTPHPLSLNLEDRYGYKITDRADLFKAEIISGPNKGLLYSEFVELEEGIYTTSYTSMVSGYDSVQVSFNGMELPESPVVISVLETMPKSLEIISGNNQTVTITDTTESPLTVLVKDDFGAPYAGVKVMFMIEKDGESNLMVMPKLVNEQSMTDSSGLAKVYFRAGSNPTNYVVTASLSSLPKVGFDVQAQQCAFDGDFTSSTRCGPYYFEFIDHVTSPNPKDTIQVIAQLKDQFGNKVAYEGLGINWQMSNTLVGEVIEASTTTNALGQVSMSYYVGEFVGVQQRIKVLSSSAQEAISSVIKVQGGSVPSFKILGVDSLVAGVVSEPNQLGLFDEFGQPMVAQENLEIKVYMPSRSKNYLLYTSDDGRPVLSKNLRVLIPKGSHSTEFHVCQFEIGDKIVRAEMVVGLNNVQSDSLPIVFTADSPEQLLLESGNNQIGTVGQKLDNNLKVKIKDRWDNPVENTKVSFKLIAQPDWTSGSQFLVESSQIQLNEADVVVTTDSLGIASASFKFGDKVGEYIIIAEVQGAGSHEFKLVANPDVFAMEQNYPNPFSYRTNIPVEFPVRSEVTIEIYDPTGALVDRPVQGKTYEIGRHLIPWDASRYANGVYIYRVLATGENGKKFIQSKSLTLMNQ